ncbi:MAG: hypothetical protein NUV50_06300 [Rhodospirillales bacterium]|nr:hypothetical protein [Rhodospirillales bacterium]
MRVDEKAKTMGIPFQLQNALALTSHTLQVSIYGLLGALLSWAWASNVVAGVLGGVAGILFSIILIAALNKVVSIYTYFIINNKICITHHNFFSTLFWLVLYVEIIFIHDMYAVCTEMLMNGTGTSYDTGAFLVLYSLSAPFPSVELPTSVLIVVVYMVAKYTYVISIINKIHYNYLKSIVYRKFEIDLIGLLFVLFGYICILVLFIFLIAYLFTDASAYYLLIEDKSIYDVVGAFFYIILVFLSSRNIKKIKNCTNSVKG